MKNKTGIVIAAAFIGPGTVTTASMAGANVGLHLAWALLFSIIATCLFQDMAVRLGYSTQKGLSEAILALCRVRWIKVCVGALVIGAIGIGNAAYQSGNLTGAGLGIAAIGMGTPSLWAGILGIIALLLLFSGSYRYIETVLVTLVAMMSLVFFTTLVFTAPNWSTLLDQAASPRFSVETLSLTLALIGTTIVPYNLFLHASLIASQHKHSDDIGQIRRDSALAISFGGMVTLVIMSTASLTFFIHGQELESGNLSQQLAPLLGDYAYLFFALGLFSAGLTSAITAPLAAGYAISALLGWQTDIRSRGFRSIVVLVVLLGSIFGFLGTKPLALILVAQVTNAILLPIIIGILLWVMNYHPALGKLKNSGWLNFFSGCCFIAILALAIYKLWQLAG